MKNPNDMSEPLDGDGFTKDDLLLILQSQVKELTAEIKHLKSEIGDQGIRLKAKWRLPDKVLLDVTILGFLYVDGLGCIAVCQCGDSLSKIPVCEIVIPET